MNISDPRPSVPAALSTDQSAEINHFVQFYDNEEFLLDTLTGYVDAGLRGRDVCIVIATAAHRNGLDARLQARGFDVPAALGEGDYIPLDAASTLSLFMVDDQPNPERFMTVIGGILERASRDDRPVRAFGEMVALLWADGNSLAATRLEGLWNELGKRYRFSLFCAYPMTGFQRAHEGTAFAEICASHGEVISGTRGAELLDHGNPGLLIALLQQKAIALETEIAERKQVESRLARREKELADFLENSVVGLHQVGPDGTILWANQAELNLLGYGPEEYIGQHIADFHVDPEPIVDILARLQRGESLYGYPARLQSKNGLIKDVLIHSNGLFEDGKFLHTRCFTLDVTERKRAEAALREMNFALMHAMPGISVLGSDGRYIGVNPFYAEMLGYKADELTGMDWRPTVHPDDRQTAIEAYQRMIRDGSAEFEARAVRKDGSIFHKQVMMVKRLDHNGSFLGHHCFVRDITERKHGEAALQKERLQLQETQRALREKVHDLETFHDVAVGRELKMMEMEKELARLREENAALRAQTQTQPHATT